MAETDAPQASAKPAETGPEAAPSAGRVFLVVVDESPELKLAIRYACVRARKTNGRVAMVHVTAPEDMQEWIGVSRLIKEESRQQAEALISALEGADEAMMFGSGMAAATAVFMALEKPTHIVASQVMYWGFRSWLRDNAEQFPDGIPQRITFLLDRLDEREARIAELEALVARLLRCIAYGECG